jgi:hypothetical protein
MAPEHDWTATANPEWYPKVLRLLQVKYPKIAAEVWGEAIAANATANANEWRRDWERRAHTDGTAAECPDCRETSVKYSKSFGAYYCGLCTWIRDVDE